MRTIAYMQPSRGEGALYVELASGTGAVSGSCAEASAHEACPIDCIAPSKRSFTGAESSAPSPSVCSSGAEAEAAGAFDFARRALPFPLPNLVAPPFPPDLPPFWLSFSARFSAASAGRPMRLAFPIERGDGMQSPPRRRPPSRAAS